MNHPPTHTVMHPVIVILASELAVLMQMQYEIHFCGNFVHVRLAACYELFDEGLGTRLLEVIQQKFTLC